MVFIMSYFFVVGMEEKQDDIIFFPYVPEGISPKLGMDFRSTDEAQEYYNNYAKQAGFSIRIFNTKKKDSNFINYRMFVCYKEGKTNEFYQNKMKMAVERSNERNRGETRCGYPARMAIKWVKKRGCYTVSHLVEKNSHGLTTPSRTHLLKSNRKVTSTQRALVQQFADTNIPTCTQLQLLENDAGGPSLMGKVQVWSRC